MKERIYYYPGFKTPFAIPGSVLVLTYLILLYTYPWYYCFPVLVIGILFIVSMNGIEIDYSQKVLNNYTDLLFYRINSKIDLSAYDTVSIVFEKETTSRFSSDYGNNDEGWNAPVISFEMYIYGFTRKKTFLCEFGSHAEARKLADKLSDKLGFKIEDTISDAIKLYKRKPFLRRR